MGKVTLVTTMWKIKTVRSLPQHSTSTKRCLTFERSLRFLGGFDSFRKARQVNGKKWRRNGRSTRAWLADNVDMIAIAIKLNGRDRKVNSHFAIPIEVL